VPRSPDRFSRLKLRPLLGLTPEPIPTRFLHGLRCVPLSSSVETSTFDAVSSLEHRCAEVSRGPWLSEAHLHAWESRLCRSGRCDRTARLGSIYLATSQTRRTGPSPAPGRLGTCEGTGRRRTRRPSCRRTRATASGGAPRPPPGRGRRPGRVAGSDGSYRRDPDVVPWKEGSPRRVFSRRAEANG